MAANQTTPSIEDQIKQCAKDCGLTAADLAPTVGAAGPVGAPWDGSRLAKLLDFIKTILPIILPLILAEDKPKT